jgi:catechol 2,3-dioxygenase-like lactoylglutathione lyase family enzyme
MPSIISYVTVGSNDTKALGAFYDAVLAPLGAKRSWEHSGWIAYGPEGEHAALMLCPPYNGEAAQPMGNGNMIGLHAESAEQVDGFHAAALANGGTCEGPPGPRPVYGEGYYVAYVRDPQGNKLSAFHKS